MQLNKMVVVDCTVCGKPNSAEADATCLDTNGKPRMGCFCKECTADMFAAFNDDPKLNPDWILPEVSLD